MTGFEAPPEWPAIKGLFAVDGYGRHIVVHGLALSLWQRYYAFLLRTEATVRLLVDGIPLDAEALDPQWFAPLHDAVLYLTLADVTFICRLDAVDTMRFEFQPQAIDGTARLRLVLRLMSTLGRRLRREVLLVHGEDELPLLGYRHPDGFALLSLAA